MIKNRYKMLTVMLLTLTLMPSAAVAGGVTYLAGSPRKIRKHEVLGSLEKGGWGEKFLYPDCWKIVERSDHGGAMKLAPTKRCAQATGGKWQISIQLSPIRGLTSAGPEFNIDNDDGWNIGLVENINFGDMNDGDYLSNHFWQTRILCGGSQSPTDVLVEYSDYVKSSDQKRVAKAHKPPQIFKDFIKGFQCKDTTK